MGVGRVDFNLNETFSHQRIVDLREQGERQRLIRSARGSPARGHGRSLRDGVRSALGYRLVTIGWRLLDGGRAWQASGPARLAAADDHGSWHRASG